MLPVCIADHIHIHLHIIFGRKSGLLKGSVDVESVTLKARWIADVTVEIEAIQWCVHNE